MGKKVFGSMLFVAVVAVAVGMTMLMGKNDTGMMLFNFSFLGVMVILYFAGIIGGFFRMWGLEQDFWKASKKAERNDSTLKTDKVFEIRVIDRQLKNFWTYSVSMICTIHGSATVTVILKQILMQLLCT